MAFQTDAGTIGLWRRKGGKFELAAIIAAWNSDKGLGAANTVPPAYGLELVVTLDEGGGVPAFNPGNNFADFFAKRINSAKPWSDVAGSNDKIADVFATMKGLFPGSPQVVNFRVDSVFDWVKKANQDPAIVPPLNSNLAYVNDVVNVSSKPTTMVGKLSMQLTAGTATTIDERLHITDGTMTGHRVPYDMPNMIFLPKGQFPLVPLVGPVVDDWIRARSYVRGGSGVAAKWPKWTAPGANKTDGDAKVFGDGGGVTFDKYSDFEANVSGVQIEAKEGQITNPL